MSAILTIENKSLWIYVLGPYMTSTLELGLIAVGTVNGGEKSENRLEN